MRKIAIATVLGLICLVGPLAAAPTTLPTPAAPAALDEGQFGQTYLLRDSVNITLESAEYTVARVVIGDICYFPQAGEKLLILRFRVQNPRKDPLTFNGSTVPFSVIDAAGADHKSVQDVGMEPTHRSAALDLKPGEGQDNLYTVLVTSGVGADSTLVLELGREGRAEDSLRFSLPGKVKPLLAPFASPKDPSGATALSTISAHKDVFYPLALLDVRLDSAAFSAQTLGGDPPGDGQRYFTVIITVKNKSGDLHGISGVNFAPVLRDSQGTALDYNQTLLQPSLDASGDAVLDPDAEARIRFFWPLPKETCVGTLSLAEGESRAYVFDVSGAK